MEDSVNNVTDDFVLRGRMITGGLKLGFVKANEDFPMNRFGGTTSKRSLSRSQVSIVEGDDVGRASVTKESFIEPDHLRVGDQVNRQVVVGQAEAADERLNDVSKEPEVHPPGRVLLLEEKRHV
jgi:hypothetical protein